MSVIWDAGKEHQVTYLFRDRKDPYKIYKYQYEYDVRGIAEEWNVTPYRVYEVLTGRKTYKRLTPGEVFAQYVRDKCEYQKTLT
jgi:hypothetical protein